MSEEQAKVYKNPNNDPKGRWRAVPMTAQGYRPNQMYPIVDPKGGVHYPPEGRCWSTIEPEYKKLLAQGRIYFGKNIVQCVEVGAGTPVGNGGKIHNAIPPCLLSIIQKKKAKAR